MVGAPGLVLLCKVAAMLVFGLGLAEKTDWCMVWVWGGAIAGGGAALDSGVAADGCGSE